LNPEYDFSCFSSVAPHGSPPGGYHQIEDPAMTPKPNAGQPGSEAENSVNRREFLRKSVYAAYATPLITALLVEKASAYQSGRGGGHETFCKRHPWHEKCQ
jgi:hypothetical protein